MGLFSIALDFALAQSAKEVISQGLEEALGTMESMLGNAGQESVYISYVVGEFEQNAQADVEDGWEDVDIGEYMDFMGEIVSEGNNIMQATYDYAQELEAGGADFSEDAIDELGDEAEFEG